MIKYITLFILAMMTNISMGDETSIIKNIIIENMMQEEYLNYDKHHIIESSYLDFTVNKYTLSVLYSKEEDVIVCDLNTSDIQELRIVNIFKGYKVKVTKYQKELIKRLHNNIKSKVKNKEIDKLTEVLHNVKTTTKFKPNSYIYDRLSFTWGDIIVSHPRDCSPQYFNTLFKAKYYEAVGLHTNDPFQVLEFDRYISEYNLVEKELKDIAPDKIFEFFTKKLEEWEP